VKSQGGEPSLVSVNEDTLEDERTEETPDA
jgi:hypothetical protein